MSNGTAESENKAKGNWIHELLKLALASAIPTLVTIGAGVFIYGVQTDIQAKIDSNQEILKNELAHQSALGEEFYKRRLAVYESACRELAVAEAALNNAGNATENETQAFDVISKFDQLNKGNSLYWSNGLQNGLDQFWALGVEKLKDRKWDDPDVNERITKEISALHKLMKNDVVNLATSAKQN